MLNSRKITLSIILMGLLTVAPFHYLYAEPVAIAVIIDDIGHNLEKGKRVINSQLPITCSILPARPYSIKLARLAHQQGKEVMLHLPMQASKSEILGHGALTADMSKQELSRIVNISIDAIPHASGINNHMGSLLTRNEDHMEWLMQTIANRDENLFFVDSRTSSQTIAGNTAHSYHIPSVQRDIFLDATASDTNYVRQQVKRLIKTAKQRGYALAIGHPYTNTLTVLEQELSKLSTEEVQLVTVSELINIATSYKLANTSDSSWHMYSSLSLKAAKN